MNWLLHFSVTLLLICYVSAQEEYVYYANLQISYKYYTRPMTWLDAKTTCIGDNARLAMPRNDKEANTILEIHRPNSVISGQELIFLDSHDLFETDEFITRGYNVQYFFHEFENDKPTNFTDRNCLAMHIRGKLHDTQCIFQFPFICQQEYPPNIENWEKSVRPLFPTDPTYKYDSSSGKYFKLNMFPRTWPLARASCHDEGGQLAVIKSKSEEIFLTAMFNDPGNLWPNKSTSLGDLEPYALLGFHDFYQSREFYTVMDEKLDSIGYVNWGTGEPNNEQERCGSLSKEGTLNDFSCSTKAYFFCERMNN